MYFSLVFAVITFLFLFFPRLLSEGYARPILANIIYIAYPIFLIFNKSVPFIENLKNTGLKLLLYWLFGSVISYLGYSVFHSVFNVSMINWFYLSCLLSFVWDVIKFSKNQFKIHSKKIIAISLKEIIPYILILVTFFLLYPFLLKNSVNLTDNFNHQTVVNSLLRGNFSFFPSDLSLSLQLNSYSTLFHFGLSISNLFFTADQLIKFYEINQYLMIVIICYIISHISNYIIKNKYIGFIVSAIFTLTSGPIPTFNHTSLVPSLIHIILTLGLMLYILETQKIQSSNISTYLVMGLIMIGYIGFHFINTLLMIPVLIVFYLLFCRNNKSKPQLSAIHPMLSRSVTIITYILIFFTWVTKFKPISVFQNSNALPVMIQELLISEASKSVGGLIRGYLFGLSPVVYISSLLGALFLAFSKNNTSRFTSLILVVIIILSHIPILFTERVGLSFVLVTVIIILYLVSNYSYKFGYNFVLMACMISVIATPIFGNATKQDYYTRSFWNTNSYSIIGAVKLLLNNIDKNNVEIISDPMTNQMIEAVYDIKGEGAYASIRTREKLINLLNNSVAACNTKQDKLIINSTRAEDWKKLKDKALVLNNNIWFDNTTTNFTVKLIKCS